jgi:hypothetical protein
MIGCGVVAQRGTGFPPFPLGEPTRKGQFQILRAAMVALRLASAPGGEPNLTIFDHLTSEGQFVGSPYPYVSCLCLMHQDAKAASERHDLPRSPNGEGPR